jgi:hypothetical protein
MGLVCVLGLAFVILGIAASVKYLRTWRPGGGDRPDFELPSIDSLFADRTKDEEYRQQVDALKTKRRIAPRRHALAWIHVNEKYFVDFVTCFIQYADPQAGQCCSIFSNVPSDLFGFFSGFSVVSQNFTLTEVRDSVIECEPVFGHVKKTPEANWLSEGGLDILVLGGLIPAQTDFVDSPPCQSFAT